MGIDLADILYPFAFNIILIVVRGQYPSGYKYQVSFHINNNYMSESNLVLILRCTLDPSNRSKAQ